MDQSNIHPIEFIDIKTQRDRVRDRVEEGWRRVVDHGQFVMGPEIRQLEESLAGFTGARNVISCSSGTDALWLALLALGVGAGDAVFVPSWTFTATAEAVCLVGATPVFVDVDEQSMNMSPESLKAAVEWVREKSALRPRAVIPVDLFGLPATYAIINQIAHNEKMTVISDAAQSFGGRLGNRRVGVLTDVTTTSFFPAKPLGCWGDGGAIFTDDGDLAEVIRSIRIHGRGTHGKYDNVRIGTNGRMNTLQAVVLLEKLQIFEEELRARQEVTDRYARRLGAIVQVPRIPPDSASAWAQYTIRTDRRDHLQKALARERIRTEIYYPRPLHEQQPYAGFPVSPEGLPVTEQLKTRVLSLPMHPYLSAEQCDYICEAIRAALG